MQHSFPHDTITSSTLQRQLGKVIKRVSIQREHLTVESNGFPVAVMMPPQDYEALLTNHEGKPSNQQRKSK